jgi:hypothetical protein
LAAGAAKGERGSATGSMHQIDEVGSKGLETVYKGTSSNHPKLLVHYSAI